MLLTITYTGKNTQDLGYLLYKNPARAQEFKIPMGKAYVFYPEVSDERTTVALLVDLDPLDLAKGRVGSNEGGLFDYVNDRPYTSSSFMSTAITRVFHTAMTGRCDSRRELAESALELEARVYMLPVRADKGFINEVFEPLGYDVAYETFSVDEKFPEWGESPYVNLTIKGKVRLSELLNQLYTLIPVLDAQKHYYVSEDEIDSLFEHGGDWLKAHPKREKIIRRYFPKTRAYAEEALKRMAGREDPTEDKEAHKPLDAVRLEAVKAQIESLGVTSVADLGCGEGKLLSMLKEDKSLRRIAGMDVSISSLEKAVRRLGLRELSGHDSERFEIFQGSLMYKDKRLKGYDLACAVEVVEHIDAEKLPVFEENIFKYMSPKYVIITTPNRDYNALYENIGQDGLRHSDHRFEWSRAEFKEWVDKICGKYGYEARIEEIGEADEGAGAPTQMGVFTK